MEWSSPFPRQGYRIRDCYAVAAEGGRSCLKVWVAKTVHLLEWVRNLDRYKRPILASLLSAVLIISIIFVGSFLLTARSGSSEGYSYFEIKNRKVHMINVTMYGPVMYHGLQVTNVTADWANITGMLLVSHLSDGRNLTMWASNAIATKLVVYTTLIKYADVEIYGNSTRDYKFPVFVKFNMYMKAVYQQAKSLSTGWLNLTCV